MAAGTVFAFLGANGAGKSTTISCLTTVLPFDSGTARWKWPEMMCCAAAPESVKPSGWCSRTPCWTPS
ncbi:ATP-binding cassette domain-containing protein [Arthrobacter sp. zg-Y1143]|uniref:ATP-binding cassette domain-containing protein n=1 Tax=Arthrobacter sp. zg-Y1143 TaxID=3049065 RepID=UPI0024C43086|nr:ATP-binding cassette domain-containing protein [Arthrobacter sp. zg-Y1143]MDK1326568.1 ATP-binding cassette domain-containing protein [Arthrobacter sp. zg-Y1143]